MTSSDGPRPGLIDLQSSISVPETLLTSIASEIAEIEELQVVLTIFRLVAEKGGAEHPIAEDTVGQDRWLRRALRIEGSPSAPTERIAKGLALATGRGTLLRFTTRAGHESRAWCYLNTIENQTHLARMATGVATPPEELRVGDAMPLVEPEQPNVFRLYEQNIGLLTPLIAERIVTALERYPGAWIEEAIAEAVAYNRRNWRYIARILENWAVAGRGDDAREATLNEENRRRDAHLLDPNQYRDGRHLDRTGRR
jgi:DNA replication protein